MRSEPSTDNTLTPSPLASPPEPRSVRWPFTSLDLACGSAYAGEVHVFSGPRELVQATLASLRVGFLRAGVPALALPLGGADAWTARELAVAGRASLELALVPFGVALTSADVGGPNATSADRLSLLRAASWMRETERDALCGGQGFASGVLRPSAEFSAATLISEANAAVREKSATPMVLVVDDIQASPNADAMRDLHNWAHDHGFVAVVGVNVPGDPYEIRGHSSLFNETSGWLELRHYHEAIAARIRKRLIGGESGMETMLAYDPRTGVVS